MKRMVRSMKSRVMDSVYLKLGFIILHRRFRATGFNDWYDTEKSDFNDDCPQDVKKQILENIIIFDLNDQDEAFNAVHSLSRSMFMEGVQEIRNQFKLLMEIDNIG